MPIIIWLREINILFYSIQSFGHLFKEKILAEVEDVGFGKSAKLFRLTFAYPSSCNLFDPLQK
jgi:hypothetical protein